MPMKEGYHNPVMPLDRPKANKAPHAYQMTQQPATRNAGTGRTGESGLGWISGGDMNLGGKRRPKSRTVK